MPRTAHNSEKIITKQYYHDNMLTIHLTWAAIQEETDHETKPRNTMVARREIFFCTYCGTSTIAPNKPSNAPKRGFRTIKCHGCKRVQVAKKRVYFLKHPSVHNQEAEKKKRKRQPAGSKPHLQQFSMFIEAEEVDEKTFVEHMNDLVCCTEDSQELEIDTENMALQFLENMFHYDAIVLNMIIHFDTVQKAIHTIAKSQNKPMWIYLSENWEKIKLYMLQKVENSLIEYEKAQTVYQKGHSYHKAYDAEETDSSDSDDFDLEAHQISKKRKCETDKIQE